MEDQTPKDLIEESLSNFKNDLQEAMDTFLKQTGYPIYEVTIGTETGAPFGKIIKTYILDIKWGDEKLKNIKEM